MTLYLIKFTLLSTLASGFMAGGEIGAAQGNGDWKALTPRSGNHRAFRTGGADLQAPTGGAGQNQQKPPARKQKSLYEYSPEDLLPGTQESEALKLDQRKPRQPRPTRPDQPSTRATPLQTPAATPYSTPSRIGNSATALATPTATPEASRPAGPQNEPIPRESRGKLTNIFLLFLVSLSVLAYLVKKLLQQLRETQGMSPGSTGGEQRPLIQTLQLSVESVESGESEAAAERPIDRAEKNAKSAKPKMRKARYG